MGKFLGFSGLADFNTYVTFVFLGMSIMMVVSAITSAPAFVTEYYVFATGKPGVECEKPFFWNNANTFFNVGTYVAQIIFEPLALARCTRKLPLQPRLILAVSIPLLELVLLIIIPAIKIPSQDGAIAVLMVVSVVGGFSKALCDSTTNALVGPFPTKFMNGGLWGLTIIALFMSILQCILKGAMGNTYWDYLTQSRIYLGIGIFIQVLALIEVLIMHRNPYAQKYVAEFRVKKQNAVSDNVDCNADDDQIEPVGDLTNISPVRGSITLEEAEEEHLEDKLDPIDELREVPGHKKTVLNASGDADKMIDADQTGNLTSSDQMMRTNAIAVFKKVWPMMLCAFTVFFTSMFIFPGVFFLKRTNNTWYTTIIVLLFNVGDFISRILLMFPILRPSPKFVIAGTLARLIVIPLLVLCIRDIIPGIALPLVLIAIVGVTNGFFGSMALIHCPRTPSLSTAGERSIAAILGGISLMFGLCFGSNMALSVTLTF